MSARVDPVNTVTLLYLLAGIKLALQVLAAAVVAAATSALALTWAAIRKGRAEEEIARLRTEVGRLLKELQEERACHDCDEYRQLLRMRTGLKVCHP